MSDHDLLERMQKQMDRMSDKLDEVLSGLSDIRANEQITARRFDEIDDKYRRVNKRIDELDAEKVSLQEFRHIQQVYGWGKKILVTAVISALVWMVVERPQSFIKPENVIEKPKQTQTNGQQK